MKKLDWKAMRFMGIVNSVKYVFFCAKKYGPGNVILF